MEQYISVQDKIVDRIITARGQVNTPEQLLCAAGVLSLRHRAGYIPDDDPRPLANFLEPDTTHDLITYEHNVLKMLARIYRGSYQQTYREWLHFVTLDDCTFPYEALPVILVLATRYPDTRSMTKRIIGTRGRWLIEHTTHRGWDWARAIKPAKRPRLTKYRKLESRVIEHLERTRYRRIPLEATYEMQNMTFPWSRHFSRVLIETLARTFTTGAQYQPSDIEQRLDVLQWSIHPEQTEVVNGMIKDHFPYVTYTAIRLRFLELMRFRQDLRSVFADDA